MAKASKPAEDRKTAQPVKKATVSKQKTAEQIAFEKASKEGHDPNKLENPHTVVMDRAKAEEIVKKYEGFTGSEAPNELIVARKVLGTPDEEK